MDSTNLQTITVLLIILPVTLVSVTSATLKCYSCTSERHGDVCRDTFQLTSANTSFIVDNCGSCMKTVFKRVQPHVYIRNCTKATTFKLGCTRKNENNRNESQQCACNENLCNGARSEIMAVAVVMFICFVCYYILSQLH